MITEMQNNKIKQSIKYFFSVEGETEQWYLQQLQKIINNHPEAACKVNFNCKVEKDPCKRVKSISIVDTIKIVHIFDREGEQGNDPERFENVLKKMLKAERLGKDIEYILGYSNLSFDLWIILHKMDCFSSVSYNNDYVALLNKAYSEKFENLKQYKNEKNFKKILNKLSIEDIKNAVERANRIMNNNEKVNLPDKIGKFSFYKENHSLSLGEVVGNILRDVGL